MPVNAVTQIKQTLKRVKKPEIRERLLMVKTSHEKSLRDAADEFGVTHGKIDFWKKRYHQFGLRGLKTKQRPGRPPKINDQQAATIKQTVSKKNMRQGWRTTHVRELIRQETGVKYTKRHTIRILQKWGMARVTPRPRYAHSDEKDRKKFLKKTRLTWRVLTPKSGGAAAKTKTSSSTT